MLLGGIYFVNVDGCYTTSNIPKMVSGTREKLSLRFSPAAVTRKINQLEGETGNEARFSYTADFIAT